MRVSALCAFSVAAQPSPYPSPYTPPPPTCYAQWGVWCPNWKSGWDTCKDHLDYAVGKEGKSCKDALTEIITNCSACDYCGEWDCPSSCDVSWGSCQPDPDSGSCRDHLAYAITTEGKSCVQARNEVHAQCSHCTGCGVWDCARLPCTHGVCCNPYAEDKQYCPDGSACQECGGGHSCQCPDGLMV